MSSDPWNKKVPHMDWSEQVEEDLERDAVVQETTSSEFPSLGEAAKTPTTKQSRKMKPRAKMSLVDFMSEESGKGGSGSYFAGGTRNMTDSEIRRMLPTAPREKDPNQPLTRNWNARSGGGFQRGNGGLERDDRGGPRQSRDREEFVPSRADESKDWGADRRGGGSRSYDHPGSRSSSQGRHEEREHHHGRDYDNWSRDNRFQPSHRHHDDRDRSRRGYGFHNPTGGMGTTGGPQKIADDRWAPSSGPSVNDRPSQGGRPRLNLDKRTKPLPEAGETPAVAKGTTRDSVFGHAKPREEVLRDRATSSDVFSSKSDLASEKDYLSQPGSPGVASFLGSSASAAESRADHRAVLQGKPREDPFGGARPREMVLNERSPHSGRNTPTSVDH